MTHRHFGLSRPVAATGNPPQPGSRGEGTQNYPHAVNIIKFPQPISSLGSAANSERRSAAAPLSIPDDSCALCALGIVLASFTITIGLLVFAGYEIFGLVG